MNRSFATMAMAGFLVLNGDARAWAQASQPQIEQFDIMILQDADQIGRVAPPMIAAPPTIAAPPMMVGNDIDFISMPLGLGGETVTGAPYSAEAVTVVVQTLADGNRISRESKAAVFRDTAGRTRREQGLAVIGAMVGRPEDHKQVQITDPEAGVTYILDMSNRTAHKLAATRMALAQPPLPAAGAGAGTYELPTPPLPLAGAAGTFEIPLPPPPPGGHVQQGAMFYRRDVFAGSKPAAIEQLGTQIVEGIEAEGTRSTITIPAGQIGNELPLDIVSERWFSPELKVLVLSRQSDPRFGQTTYRLTNIVRAEPSPDLFEPPADFTVVEPGAAAGPMIRMQKR